MQRLMQPIVIQLKPSPLLLGLLGIVSMMCCAILAHLQLAFAIKFALISLVILLTVYMGLRDALLLLPQSWRSLHVNSQGTLKLINRKGLEFTPALASSSYVHSLMVILNIKKSLFTLSLPPVILFDNKQNAESLRKLRIWLRWWPHHAEDAAELQDNLA